VFTKYEFYFLLAVHYVAHALFTAHYSNIVLKTDLFISSWAFPWYSSLCYPSASQTLMCFINTAARTGITLILQMRNLGIQTALVKAIF